MSYLLPKGTKYHAVSATETKFNAIMQWVLMAVIILCMFGLWWLTSVLIDIEMKERQLFDAYVKIENQKYEIDELHSQGCIGPFSSPI